MNERKERCETCKWWVKRPRADPKKDDLGPIGDCHRFPPVPVYQEMTLLDPKIWVTAMERSRTKGGDFCGEWTENASELSQDRPFPWDRVSIRTRNTFEESVGLPETMSQIAQLGLKRFGKIKRASVLSLNEILEVLVEPWRSQFLLS